MLRFVLLLGLVVSFALPAHAEAPLPPPSIAAPDTAFSLHGRISLRRAETAYHGVLDWLHSADADDIDIIGPLGQGVASLRRNVDGATLWMGDGKVEQAPSIDDLASRLFGVQVPVATLIDWLHGIAPTAEHDSLGRPTSLSQTAGDDVWYVEWQRYADATPTALPRLLVINGRDFSLRIFVDEWDVP